MSGDVRFFCGLWWLLCHGFFPVLMEFCHLIEITFPAEFGVDYFWYPELRQLASFLPALLVQDRGASTVITYLRAYASGKTWADEHVLFACRWCLLCILSLILQPRSLSSLNTAVYGVSWVH